ncbi:MAG: MBL fold metallo-hydrolase [Treponema sp.]|nr:MBL fold metallo-hydrolase [Treponema sp.]MBR6193785.1 MBL fold metallo-hydrolase [Treponema sp.]
MKIHFWGVRGSLPAPLTARQVQAKIATVVERITAKDVESEDAKMRFLASLPPWIFGTIGGNTPCIELVSDSGKQFILDCGSGLREFGVHGNHPEDRHYTILVSHFHWDHIQGIPFFGPIFDKRSHIDFYSAFPAAERILAEQNRCPYFPQNGAWENVGKTFHFHLIHELEPFYIDGVKITCKKMQHPGNSYSYSFEQNGKKIIYSTDVELRNSDFDMNDKRNWFFDNADVLIMDCQYTGEDAIAKANWGHSIFSYVVDFASKWHAKKLYFFHHEPIYDDKKIHSMLRAAKWYQDYSGNNKTDIDIAVEGQEIEI